MLTKDSSFHFVTFRMTGYEGFFPKRAGLSLKKKPQTPYRYCYCKKQLWATSSPYNIRLQTKAPKFNLGPLGILPKGPSLSSRAQRGIFPSFHHKALEHTGDGPSCVHPPPNRQQHHKSHNLPDTKGPSPLCSESFSHQPYQRFFAPLRMTKKRTP